MLLRKAKEKQKETPMLTDVLSGLFIYLFILTSKRKSAVLTPACQVLKWKWNNPVEHNALFMHLITEPLCAISFSF